MAIFYKIYNHYSKKLKFYKGEISHNGKVN